MISSYRDITTIRIVTASDICSSSHVRFFSRQEQEEGDMTWT